MDGLISEYALVHPMACVADSHIHAGVRVWQFASVIRGAVVLEGAQIAHGALVDGAHIGQGVLVGSNASIHPGTVIDDHAFIGPGVTFCNDAWPRTDKGGFDLFLPAFAMEYEQRKRQATIVVEKGASIGANATILPGIVIGAGAMVSAGAVVRNNVGPAHLLHRDGRVSLISDEREKAARETRNRTALYCDGPI